MIPNNTHKKPDGTRCSLTLLAIVSTVISIGILMLLINLLWAVVILLALCAGYYGLRAQTLNLNRLAYRLRLFIYRIL